MFNVLPDIFKKEIKTEYFLRRLVVVFAFVIFLQISFLIFIITAGADENEITSNLIHIRAS